MTDWPDMVNGSFESLGALFITLSIRRAWVDKRVAGVAWLHVGFWSAWGLWNLFYYWNLEQYLSWYGGIAVTTANTIWLGQLLYYSKWPGGRNRG